jgi:hypothetical protein
MAEEKDFLGLWNGLLKRHSFDPQTHGSVQYSIEYVPGEDEPQETENHSQSQEIESLGKGSAKNRNCEPAPACAKLSNPSVIEVQNGSTQQKYKDGNQDFLKILPSPGAKGKVQIAAIKSDDHTGHRQFTVAPKAPGMSSDANNESAHAFCSSIRSSRSHCSDITPIPELSTMMVTNYFDKPLVEEPQETNTQSSAYNTNLDCTGLLSELVTESSNESDRKSRVASSAEAAQQLLKEEARQSGTFSLTSPLLRQVLNVSSPPIRPKEPYRWPHQHNTQILQVIPLVLRMWSRGTNQDHQLLAALSRNKSGTVNPVREKVARTVLGNIVIGDPDDGKDLINLRIEANKIKAIEGQQFLQEVLKDIKSMVW